MDIVAERREELFPDLRKVIVDYEVDISGGHLNLNVTSAPVPDIISAFDAGYWQRLDAHIRPRSVDVERITNTEIANDAHHLFVPDHAAR